MKAAVKPQERTSLKVTEWIKASPMKLFEALTEPVHMNQWFIPCEEGMKSTSKTELKVGGAYSIAFEKSDGGKPHIVSGKYLEILPGKKLSFSWGWTESEKSPAYQGSIVTIDFEEKDGGTQLTLTHERLPETQSVEQHTDGWKGCLGGLKKYLTA